MSTVILSGNTYKAKDGIKKFASAKWDADRKAWTMSAEGFAEFVRSMPTLAAGIKAESLNASKG